MSDIEKVIPFASFDLAASEDKSVTCDFFAIDDGPEMVNQPKHYNDESGVPCCDVTDFMMFNGGNCFKYLYRCGRKFDGVEDLKKAAWYAERAFDTDVVNVNPKWRKNIREVARYRDGYIHKAMMAVRWNNWNQAQYFINCEIGIREYEVNQ